MIDINTLPTPAVLQELDYEAILADLVAAHRIKYPDWEPIEGDEHYMMLEDFAYREFHLRAFFNDLAKAFFLFSATGADLEHIAASYGIERLEGSMPHDTYEFKLSEALTQDVTIPTNLILTDETSTYEGKLLEDVTIKAGSLSATGIVELQLYIDQSDIKTQIITTSLPFVVEASAKGSFSNGAAVEDDEKLRYRILLSMADKSTAGSEETYKSFTFKADERVEDVSVLKGLNNIESYVASFYQKTEAEILEALYTFLNEMATVRVYYYSSVTDDLIKTRIEEMLNAQETRPVSDNVIVSEAVQVPYSITAQLKILPNQETATIYTNAVNSLDKGLKSLKKIGVDITLSEINDFLKVSGVKEVVITQPESNVVCEANQIGVNSGNTISYTVL